jgi:succinate dehydrogenase / fumarate reductase cytochrome b subunit
VSSAAISPAIDASSNPTYFLLRRLHSLTGIFFGLYLIVHLTVNATMIQGLGTAATPLAEGHPSIYQEQVSQIHRLPLLLGIELSFIFAPLIIHTVYGLYVAVNGKPNTGNYGYVKNWFYVMQRVTAIILVAFIFFHVGGFYGWFGKGLEFDADEAFRTTVHHIQRSPLISLVIYPLGILCATFHLANGFWTGAIAWGLTVSRKAQQRWGWVCIGLFLFTTACGFTALFATFVHRSAEFAGKL